MAYTHDSLSLISSADPAIHSGNVMAVDELQAVGSQIYSYGQSVKTITLEAVIAETGTEAELYIIKMDCECGEWDIMPNISRELAAKVGLILGEWHGSDYKKIIEVGEQCFPHLYTSTHRGWGCGNFWSVPKDESCRHYFADSLSLGYGNDFSQYKVSLLEQELTNVHNRIMELESDLEKSRAAMNALKSGFFRRFIHRLK